MKVICVIILLTVSLLVPISAVFVDTQTTSACADILQQSKSDISIESMSESGYDTYSPSEITHFFTHCLVAYPEIAFRRDNFMCNAYADDCVTVDEFKTFLKNMYSKNYVLVDIRDTYTRHGEPRPLNVKVPKGKKPLILSFDDVNYYKKKMHLGMNDKLVVRNGEIATYTQNASAQYNNDNEHITILENFIAAHPDFSYKNARGVICLTGFDGVLGYRTENDSPNKLSEIAMASKVIATLKSKGWLFASHSYGHHHTRRISEAALKADTSKWLSEVGSLVGETDIYCYPYGEWDISDGETMSGKQKLLNDSGFRLYLGVGEKNFYGLAPWDGTKHSRILLMDRKPYDGIALRNLQAEYSSYFDCADIHNTRLAVYPLLASSK